VSKEASQVSHIFITSKIELKKAQHLAVVASIDFRLALAIIHAERY
jgi:hypothetical protein